MTIALPGSSKLGFSGLLSRKRRGVDTTGAKPAQKTLKPEEIARRFAQDKNAPVKPAAPAKLNDSEKQDRDRMSSLRGALYSKD